MDERNWCRLYRATLPAHRQLARLPYTLPDFAVALDADLDDLIVDEARLPVETVLEVSSPVSRSKGPELSRPVARAAPLLGRDKSELCG